MSVTKFDEKNLINFLLKTTSNASPEDIFNLWNKVYDTSRFSMDDIDYIIQMITMYKEVKLPKDLKESYFKGI